MSMGRVLCVSRIAALLLAAMTLGVWPVLAQARPINAVHPSAAAGVVSIEPISIEASIGEPVTVYVSLTDVEDIYGIDIGIAYDPKVIEISGGKVAPVWDVFDSQNHLVFANTAAGGYIHYMVMNMNPAEPFSGWGHVCAITIVPLKQGQTVLEFTLVKGSTRDADPLWPDTIEGLVCVGLPCPTDTPDATPTAVPTATSTSETPATPSSTPSDTPTDAPTATLTESERLLFLPLVFR